MRKCFKLDTETEICVERENEMQDKKKFEKFKDEMIADNEKRYGREIREKYGEEAVDASNAKIKGMSEERMQEAENLRKQMEETLKEAFEQGDAAGELAQRVCEMHKRWLCIFWKDGMYSKEAHRGLADMYVADERFRANYDKIAPGCTEFLRDAIYIYCEQ